MKVTFVKEYQGPQSGNELYRVNDEADLLAGQWLIDEGIAREGWGPVKVEKPPEPAPEPAPDFASMTVAQLRKAAKDAGLSSSGTKAQLIERLES